MNDILYVSLTAAQTFRTCEEQYSLRYIYGLERVDRPLNRDLGTILHAYLGEYYSGLKAKKPAQTAHVTALLKVQEMFDAELQAGMQAAWNRGDESKALEFQNMLPTVQRIAQRYYELRGRQDAEDFEVLIVEQRIEIKLKPTIRSVSVVDLITRNLRSGQMSLWEHKTVGKIPDGDIRLRDLQTVLYKDLSQQRWKMKIHSVTWNYLRTKEPAIPDLLKSGQLTRRQDLDTTWQAYSKAIADNGLDEMFYTDVKERLVDRELESYFPRFNLPYMSDSHLLLGDYLITASAIQAKKKAWADKKSHPVRVFNFSCGGCDYQPICRTALMGGDLPDIIRLKYKSKYGKVEETTAARDNEWDGLFEEDNDPKNV